MTKIKTAANRPVLTSDNNGHNLYNVFLWFMVVDVHSHVVNIEVVFKKWSFLLTLYVRQC